MANILRLKQGGPSSYACPPLITAILILVACMFGSVGISADEGPVVRIMTQNMYEGTNFQELAAAQSTVEFLTAVATTYQNIDNTKPAERAAAIAREIADYHPDLIALQEASIVRTGPTLSPPSPATIEHSNLLQLLLDELARLGQHYATVAVQPLLDAQAPSTLGFDVRLTTQDAILARTDLPPGNLKLSNIQIQRFQTNLTVPTPVGSITFPRGWISIDVKRHGRTFKFVTTHLEVAHLEVVPSIQLAQAMELVQSTGDTTLPLVFAGDFNASADDNMDPTFATYQSITHSGFADAWRIAHSQDTGFTCCQAGDLLNADSLLSQRIDLVLLRGGFGVDDVRLVGNQQNDRTPSGLWPSDHAGIAATLQLLAK